MRALYLLLILVVIVGVYLVVNSKKGANREGFAPEQTPPPETKPVGKPLLPYGGLSLSDCEKRCVMRTASAWADGREMETHQRLPNCITMCEMTSAI